MDTKIRGINRFSLKYARKLIAEGQTVAFPTETVYGLGANIFNTDAVKSIFEKKGRPQDNPLIVHICDKSQILLVAKNVSEDAQKLIDAFMPGSITVVLEKKDIVSDVITAGLPTVAVRLPLSEEARRFICACGVPIAAPSANTSGRPSPTTAQEVFADMKGKIPLILKGKKCNVGIESTVVDCTGDTPVVLRPGIITQSMIEEVVSKKAKALGDTSVKVNSPGVKYKHYAPNCPCVLNTDGDIKKICGFYDGLLKDGHKPVVLCLDDKKHDLSNLSVVVLGKTEYDAAKNLYGTLRRVEKRFDYIIILWDCRSEFAFSVFNRLIRVAGSKII